MNKQQYLIILVIVFVSLFGIVGVSIAQRSGTLELQVDSQPLVALGSGFTYQGQLKKGSSPINATCEMSFSLYDQASAGSLVGGPVSQSVPVTNGLFSVKIDFGAGAFNGAGRWLGIQVQCPGDAAYADLGRQELTAVPYALFTSSTPYQNVVTVAKNGGDFNSVQAALDSITDAGATNPYLVWVAPGFYNETVVMKPYVRLQGAGQGTTIISSSAGTNNWIPTTATLILAANSSVSDITIGNSGVSEYNIALLALDGTSQAKVSDTAIMAQGITSGNNYGIFSYGASTDLSLINVTALSENGSENNAVQNFNAIMRMQNGSFTGRGGNRGRGIYNAGGDITLESVTALGENGIEYNYGFYNGQSGTAIVRGGVFTARSGGTTFGIYNSSSDLTVEGGSFLGEDGTTQNNGLNTNSHTVLQGGSYTGRGGEARGIYCYSAGGDLEAYDVNALGIDGTESYGLYIASGADVKLRGGSFTGRGGEFPIGIRSSGSGTILEAEGIDVLAESGSGPFTVGLFTDNGSVSIITQSALMSDVGDSILRSGTSSIILSNSRLVGDTSGDGISCTAVSRGIVFSATTCP